MNLFTHSRWGWTCGERVLWPATKPFWRIQESIFFS